MSRRAMKWLAILFVLAAAATGFHAQTEEPRRDWIDPATGHRVIRLTDQPGSSTLYFHDNAFSAAGDRMMLRTPKGVAVVDVAKIGGAALTLDIVSATARGGYFARRGRDIFLSGGAGNSGGGRGDSSVTAVNVDTLAVREVPHARGLINADETLSVHKNARAIDRDGKYPPPPPRPIVPQLQRMFPGKRMEDLTPDQRYAVTKEDQLAPRALNPGLQSFVFTSLASGEARETGFQYGDLNHLQFNPVDPQLLLYCHEGTWHEVDRTWTIRTDGTGMRLVHKRTMDMEINGHEWWSWDGKTVWFDLQTPRSQVFWLAGVNVETGRQTRVSRRARLVGRALQQLARRHAVRQRWRRSVTGGVFDRRHVDQPLPRAGRRHAGAGKAGRHVAPQLRHRPGRRRAERPHHARQEVGGVHRAVRIRSAARLCGGDRETVSLFDAQPLF